MVVDKRRVLFVGGIPSSMTEDVIREHFSKYDLIVNVRIMKDRKTRGSKGYAFVTLTDHLKIPAILAEPQVIRDRTVDVQLASRKGEKESWKEEQKKKRIFVSNLPSKVTNQELHIFFSSFGEVRNAYVIRDFDTKASLNYGYVEFAEDDIIDSLIYSNDLKIEESTLVCMPYQGRNQEKKTALQRLTTKSGSKLLSTKLSQTGEFIQTELNEKSVSDKPTKRHNFTIKKNDDSPRQVFTPVSRSPVVANSKYEYIEKSRLLNQDESNYSFKLSKNSPITGSNGYSNPILMGEGTFVDSTINSSSFALSSLKKNATYTVGYRGLASIDCLYKGIIHSRRMNRNANPKNHKGQENKSKAYSAFKLF